MDDIYMLSDGIIMNLIGTRLKAIRLKQNITQQNLAKEAGISFLLSKRWKKVKSELLTRYSD